MTALDQVLRQATTKDNLNLHEPAWTDWCILTLFPYHLHTGSTSLLHLSHAFPQLLLLLSTQRLHNSSSILTQCWSCTRTLLSTARWQTLLNTKIKFGRVFADTKMYALLYHSYLQWAWGEIMPAEKGEEWTANESTSGTVWLKCEGSANFALLSRF